MDELIYLKENNYKFFINSVVITFDDGFLGAFEHALPVLDELEMPSVIFMNMQPQIERTPLLSALVVYLMENCKNFQKYIHLLGLKKPAHLSVTPEIMQQFRSKFDMPEISKVIKFQGPLVDLETMKFWDHARMFTMAITIRSLECGSYFSSRVKATV